MILLKNVFLAYNKEYYALYDVDLEIKKGEKVAIIGENGCGKTSLLRLIAGLEKFQKGEVTIKGIPVQKIDFANDVSLGYISSKAVFFEGKTVQSNLEWILKNRGVPKEKWDSIIDNVLSQYSIELLKKARVSTLCRSDKRMVQIARLALRPLEILLVDQFDIDGDFLTKKRLEKCLEQLVDSEPADKIVLVACDKEEDCPSFINRKIYINFGSIEEKKGETE